MKKLGKVLSLVMALVLVMCSLSATAFADVQKDYVQLKADGYYSFNITDGTTKQEAVDIGASIYEADNSKREIYLYYEKTDTAYKRVTVFEGKEDVDQEFNNINTFWDQVVGDDNTTNNYIIGTITKINPISGYHFEKITDASQLTGVATDTTSEDLEQILATAYDIAHPIFSGESYDDDCIAFIYGVEERDVEGQISNVYTTTSSDTMDEEKMDAAGIQGILADTEYVYMLVKDPEETTPEAPTTEEPTTEAPTTEEPTTQAPSSEAATTAAASATATKTGDSNMTLVYIALSVVAACGLVAVTFASKKNK